MMRPMRTGWLGITLFACAAPTAPPPRAPAPPPPPVAMPAPEPEVAPPPPPPIVTVDPPTATADDNLTGSVLVWADAEFFVEPTGTPLHLATLAGPRRDHLSEAVPMRVVSAKGSLVEVV